MKKHILTVLLFSFAALAVAQEQVAATDDAGPAQSPQLDSVHVAAVRDPLLRPYKTMLKGLEAFDRLKTMAPDATLRFLLTTTANQSNPAALSLRIANDNSSVNVPIAPDSTFSLPRLPEMMDGDADLLLNARKGSVRWRPDIRTPNLSPTIRRLGDLRLECEVRWVIEKDELTFVQRNYFRMVGGPCTSSRVSTHFISAQPIVSASLVQGERRLALKTAFGGYAYLPPIHDQTWSNEALVELTLRTH